MPAPHIAPQIHHPELRSDSTLHVVGVVANPVRYHSRYRLAREWIEHMRSCSHVRLHVVEAAFGDRHHEIASSSPEDLRVRTKSEIWLKENLINLGVRHTLPRDWRYVAWVDADVTFRDSDWALEALHQLQHWPVIQPWQHCTDLGHLGGITQTYPSFGLLHQRGMRQQTHPADPYPYGHSGFAWAATRAFWEQTGGLLDFAILGSADHHQAWAMIGKVDASIHRGMHPSFFRLCHEWQQKAVRVTHRQIGFAPGRIEHAFHGSKKRRGYRERWQVLIDHKFDPDRDLVRDDQGLAQLVGKPDLEQAIRIYNRSRLEDSIDE